jgi:hypothetical protein
MKNYLYILIGSILLSACGSVRNSVANTPQDITLLTAIKKLNKKPSNVEVQNSLTDLYNNAVKQHLDNIDVYQTMTEPDKWTKIVNEYNALEYLGSVISASSTALNLIKPQSFYAETQVARQNGASDYYDLGTQYLDHNDKESSKNAYYAFKKSTEFVPAYKDAKRQMDKAYQSSILNVVINPVTDNSSYYSSLGWNRFGNSFNNDYLQLSLVKDLGGDYNQNQPARFYTDRDAQRARVNVDWIVDLTWINFDVPQPYTQQSNRNVSKQIEIGRDTANKPVYQTVSATLRVTRKYFTATGDLECRITDAFTRNNIDLNRYSSKFDWQQEYGTYSGDSRALGSAELSIINNRNFQVPRKEDILTELYQNIYPQVKNNIYNAVRW